MTLYDILEVSPSASKDVIEASWKALQRRFHPDGSQPHAERSKLINQAHDVLSDPKKRREYDAWLKAQRPTPVRLPAKRQRTVQVQAKRQRDLVDDLVELTNRAFDLFMPETPVRVTRRRR